MRWCFGAFARGGVRRRASPQQAPPVRAGRVPTRMWRGNGPPPRGGGGCPAERGSGGAVNGALGGGGARACAPVLRDVLCAYPRSGGAHTAAGISSSRSGRPRCGPPRLRRRPITGSALALRSPSRARSHRSVGGPSGSACRRPGGARTRARHWQEIYVLPHSLASGAAQSLCPPARSGQLKRALKKIRHMGMWPNCVAFEFIVSNGRPKKRE